MLSQIISLIMLSESGMYTDGHARRPRGGSIYLSSRQSEPEHATSRSRRFSTIYTFLNNNTPHSEQRRSVLIRQNVHAQTHASSLLIIEGKNISCDNPSGSSFGQNHYTMTSADTTVIHGGNFSLNHKIHRLQN